MSDHIMGNPIFWPGYHISMILTIQHQHKNSFNIVTAQWFSTSEIITARYLFLITLVDIHQAITKKRIQGIQKKSI